jgi:very-short-patch-repair endonuclease
MTKIYNKPSQKQKRRQLRKNMTKAGVTLLSELKNKKILGQRFLRQYSIGTYVLDFYNPAIKLAIEIDGPTHLSDEEIKYDKERQNKIENLNIQFLRFTNPEILHDMYNVIEKIKYKVRELLNKET